MFPFIETVRLIDGVVQHRSCHETRVARTRWLSGWQEAAVPWEELMAQVEIPNGTAKFHFEYGENGFGRVDCRPYKVRDIRSLRVITDDDITYPLKRADRSQLDRLAAQRGNCDEVLIVRKGCVTDTSYTNVAFFDGSRWITPDTPLLPGTMRGRLLADGSIVEREVRLEDIRSFRSVSLFNAMMDLGQLIVPVEQIMTALR